MERLFEKYLQKLNLTKTDFVRNIINEINWSSRLIGIKGAKGIGKTTLLLQYLKLNYSDRIEQTLYVSLESIWFSQHTLEDLARDFVRKGGTVLFLDEVHKYPGWAKEIKNIYDDYPQLKIVFTGSSLLEILNARADLSRRVIIYHMQGFSFREFLSMETGIQLNAIKLDNILTNHQQEALAITDKLKPLKYFNQYLKQGYYPFYLEGTELYQIRLEQVINMMLEIELPLLRAVDIAYVHRIKQLLAIIAQSVPFVPNVSKLSEKISINRVTLLSYLHYLEEIGLTRNLYREPHGISRLQKPAKIFLENTNLGFALALDSTNTGNARETYFANQLSYAHQLSYTETGDFWVDKKYIFEIGGKHKKAKQIENQVNAYIVADDLELGSGNHIPLWLFGFLY